MTDTKISDMDVMFADRLMSEMRARINCRTNAINNTMAGSPWDTKYSGFASAEECQEAVAKDIALVLQLRREYLKLWDKGHRYSMDNADFTKSAEHYINLFSGTPIEDEGCCDHGKPWGILGGVKCDDCYLMRRDGKVPRSPWRQKHEETDEHKGGSCNHCRALFETPIVVTPSESACAAL